MAAVDKIDSNVTGLSFAEELRFGVLPAEVDINWYPVEVNSYSDFGAEIQTVARNPINKGRQRRKGVPVDIDASGGFQMDWTQDNSQRLMQGFMFASHRTKFELASTGVDVDDGYIVTGGGLVYSAGDLLFAKDFEAAANNGLKLVAASTATAIDVAGVVADDATPGVISRVGKQFVAGDLSVTKVADQFPRLVSAAYAMTNLGLIPGEWIFVGGDLAAEQFANAANRGWARVRTITATYIELDKTDTPYVADAGATKTVRIFLGRVLRNEVGDLIRRRTYTFERTLGAPDDASTDEQAEYLLGSVPNECTVTLNTADKITLDMSFVSKDQLLRTAAEGLLGGTRHELIEGDLFNTTSNVSRIALSEVSNSASETDPLFAYVTDLSLAINNNVSLNKAIGVFGGFNASAGTFTVGGTVTAYFNDVRAVRAVRNNADITFDFALFSDNAGIVADIPLLGLGNGRLEVAQDEAITLPLTLDAGEARKIAAGMDYTLMFCFFDYLPDLAARANTL